MTEAVKAIILGVVEGITEFLPISSTGHLLVAASLLDFQNNLGGTFEIFIQLGAVLAVIFYYRADLLRQLKNVGTDASVRRLWLTVFLAFVPAGVTGFLLAAWLKDNVIDTPANSLIVALTLIVGGLLFLLVERRFAHSPSSVCELTSISYKQALIVGFIQVTALIPGISRSGASIIGGMLTGLDRQTATRFSFYLAIPTLGTATLYDLLISRDQLRAENLAYLVLGTVVSAVVAWLSIGWLLRYVSRSSFTPFGAYRIVAGVIILALLASNLLRM